MLPAPSFFFFLGASLAALRPPPAASQEACEEEGELEGFAGAQEAAALPGRLFLLPLPPRAFRGTRTRYQVTLANGSVLPKWLEYNPNTSTLQGVPMVEESGEYHLTVAAHGEACDPNTPVATASFALHVHNDITVCGKQRSTNQKPQSDNICSEGLYARDISVTFAEIIINHPAGSLTIQERLFLIYTMADYLHLDPSFLTLIPFKESFNKQLWTLTVLTEDTKYINTVENRYVGLCWPVGFGVFTMLYELVLVLRQNVQSHHLSQLLGYEIAGWRILQKGSNEKKHVGTQLKRQLRVTPSPTLRPTEIGVKTTQMEAFTVWSMTLLHTKFAVRPSAASSSLYEDRGAAASRNTEISFHSVTSKRDLGTSHVPLSVHSSPQAFSVFQPLFPAVPELLPSLTTASVTEFGRQDGQSSRTPPVSELLQTQVQQQDMHYTSKKSEPKPHFTQYFFSVPASKTQASRSDQPTVSVSVSQDPPYENMPVAHFPKEFVTNLAHSSPHAYLTTSGFAPEDTHLPVLSTISTLAKRRFPSSSVATSLFFSDCSHQNQDHFGSCRYASDSCMPSPHMKGSLFTEEGFPPLPEVLAETSKWAKDLNLMDVTSTPDSSRTGRASVHECLLAPDTSPAPQFYYSDKTPALTTCSTQESTISLHASSAEFGLLPSTSSIPAELPSLPSATPRELAGSFTFPNMSPGEELWSTSGCMSQKVFKTEQTSETFVTVPQTSRLFLMKDKASARTKMHVDTPRYFIYPTTPGGVISSSQFLSVGSLRGGASEPFWQHSSDTLQLSLPVESSGTSTLQFSMNYFSSYASGVVRSPVACPGVLQLETSDLNVASPLETKQATSQLLEDPMGPSLQADLHASSVLPGGQGQPNTSPRVLNAMNWITATIGHRFSFSIPPDTFHDQEDGDTSQLTLGMNPADSPPPGSGNWLHFNSRSQTMHGYPLADDFQYSPQEFLLFATDSEGLKTSDMLTIELLRPTTIPCHNYTVRTKNSYHSFLRERERVYLFFEKLSKYLSSGSPGSLRLLHLRPGSTLITWYDHSFCTRSDRCARDEIQGALVKLRLPGGNVNPDFVEAMLPEYNIYHTEDVVYSGTCSSNESFISNQTIAAFKDSHSWTRIVFFVLLISICAAIIIILMMTFWYCKYNKKVIGSQSMSFHGRLFISYADLEMDVLKSQKSAILGQEFPRPAEGRLPVPTRSQQPPCRPSTTLAASKLPPPPPKYRLPPLYGMDGPSRSCDSHNQSHC